MHPDELLVDEPLVRRLLAAQCPRWADLPLRPVPSAGTDNALWRLGDDLVVRLPRIGWAVDDVAKEQRWLPLLAPHLPVPIPAPVALGTPAEGFPRPWSVYRWLPGANPVVGRLADPVGLARDLGAFVRALHAFDSGTGADLPVGSRSVPLTDRARDTRDALAQLLPSDGVDVPGAVDAFERALAAPGPRAPKWVHADLSAGNLLLDGDRLAAVIDFGTLTVGDPAVDLLVAWNLLPPEARDTYREGWGVDDDTWQRGRGWALSTAAIALPYYRETNRPLADSSRRVIAEVLAAS